jgi:ribosomal protein S25
MQEENKKILIVGGNDASLAKVIMDACNDNFNDVIIYELTTDEMLAISEKRRIAAQSDAVVDLMESDENKKQAHYIASEFHKRFFEKLEQETGQENFISKSDIKKQTNFSWSKFDEIIATLDIYGHVQFLESNKNFIRIVLDDDSIISNKKQEIQKSMDYVKGLLIELQGRLKKKADKDKIETLKKKMTLTI